MSLNLRRPIDKQVVTGVKPDSPSINRAYQNRFSYQKNTQCLGEMKNRQKVKIKEINSALEAAQIYRLDKKAEALGLGRSTTWFILNAKHKNSGISPTTLNRMLASRRLPSNVRDTILEYIEKRAAGSYGDSDASLHRFRARIAGKVGKFTRTR